MAEYTASTSCDCIPLLNLDIRCRCHSKRTIHTLREPRDYKRWPWFVWFLFKLIGLYNSRNIVTFRRCHKCRLAAAFRRPYSEGENASSYWSRHSPKDPEKSEREDHGPLPVEADCVVCRTEWFDGEGEYRPYTENEIGVSKWNHCGSTTLSFLWPFTIVVFIALDMYWYIIFTLEDNDGQTMPIISKAVFLTFILLTPVLILTANVFTVIVNQKHPKLILDSGFSWYHALSVRYIVKTLQHLDLGERGLPHKAVLGLCLVWPCLNGAYRFFIIYGFVDVNDEETVHVQITCNVGMIGMLVFAAFCYLMLLMRLSLQKQFLLEIDFLRKHVGDVDLCRRRLALFAEGFGSICRLVAMWFNVIIAVSTWAFTAQICLDFIQPSATKSPNDHEISTMNNIKAQIWSVNSMFVLLPVIAIRGTDLKPLWMQYKGSVRQLVSVEHQAFWDRIISFHEEQSPVTQVKALTLMFSALGLFFGLEFPEQKDAYWSNENIVHNSTK